MRDILRELRDFDQARPSIPGEHLWVAAAGLALCGSALKRRSSAGRVLALVAGTALLYRAASGRDGLMRLMRGRSLSGRAIVQSTPLERIEDPTLASDEARGALAAPFADSPNDAERMQQSGELGVGAGIAVEIVEEIPEDPAAEAGQERIVPGLQDFMRGG